MTQLRNIKSGKKGEKNQLVAKSDCKEEDKKERKIQLWQNKKNISYEKEETKINCDRTKQKKYLPEI